MSVEFACATCGKDLMYEMPQSIMCWDSPTDKRVFCSATCMVDSEPPADCAIYRPDPEASARPVDHWKYDL